MNLMTELELSILNLKLIHKNRLEDLKKQIKELEEEIRILKDSYDRIYDV
jgi:uncharacterized membrane protein (DUF106 family)